jgi:hypothetical protein
MTAARLLSSDHARKKREPSGEQFRYSCFYQEASGLNEFLLLVTKPPFKDLDTHGR